MITFPRMAIGVPIIVFFTCSIFVTSLHAQDSDTQLDAIRTVAPPSPNAASLGKYADFPVELYTGLPSISIPIYELKGRSAKVPVSLSYHAAGNRVADIASWVGLGWALNAGGLIMRSVRGLPDETPSAYLDIRSHYNNPLNLQSGTVTAGMDTTYVVQSAYGCVDTEPDYFLFNAMGRSYKLFFGANNAVITEPYSNILITADFVNQSWSATMEDGTVLKFGGDITTREIVTTPRFPACSNGSVSDFKSAWYLKTIISPMGDSVKFTYSPVTIEQSVSFSEVDYVATSYTFPFKGGSTHFEKQSALQPQLSSIETALERMDFTVAGSDRTDLVGGRALTQVTVTSKITGQILRTFQFIQSYATAVSGNTFATTQSSAYGYRLHLDAVTEQSSDASLKKRWNFYYNPQNLPSRISMAQDHWGYFNGATSNTTLLPPSTLFTPESYSSGQREPNSSYMIAEILSKISYPTGGTTTFTFESNSISENKEQFTTAAPSLYLYLTSGQSPFVNNLTTSIVLTTTQWIKIDFSGTFSSSYAANFGTNTNLAFAELINSSGVTVQSITLQKTSGSATKYFLMTPGTYTFKIRSISGSTDFVTSNDNVSLSGACTYSQSLGNANVQTPVGGLRIKSIVSYDSIAGVSLTKSYTYENPFVIAPHTSDEYFFVTTSKTYGFSSGGIPCSLQSSYDYNTRFSNPRFILGSIQGGTIGYGKVTESEGSSGENGKNVYYYSQDPDLDVADATYVPYPPVISRDWRRGLILEKRIYTTGDVLLEKVRNTYTFDSRTSIRAYKSATLFQINGDCHSNNYTYGFVTRKFYDVLGEQVKHNTTITSTYVGTDSLVTTTTNYYENALNLEPTKTVMTNSKGENITVYKRTPLDKTDILNSINLAPSVKNDLGSDLDELTWRHIINPVIETKRLVGTNVKEQSLLSYQFYTSSQKIGGIPVLDTVYLLAEGATTLEGRVKFNRYDDFGNIIEQLKINDTKHAYIWDEKGMYPIAEVINSDVLSIAYTSFEMTGTTEGRWTFSSARNTSLFLTGLNSYNLSSGSVSRNALPTNQTYIVSFWALVGSGSPTVNGSSPIAGRTKNNWTYYEISVTNPVSNTITVSGTGTIDELRIHPNGALMSTYTYDPSKGVTTMTDPANMSTYYQYDGLGRLVTVLNDNRKVLKATRYHYAK
jgi:YD repeat-containing protein